MPIDLTSKKAQKRARKHAEESAKAAEIYNRLLKNGNTNIWLDPKVEAASHILPTPENLYASWENPAPVKTEEQLAKEQIERSLIGWPWRGDKKRPTTLAPYAINPFHDLKIPQIRQGDSKLLTTLRQNSLVCELISTLLFEHHDVASKFAATCQEAWHLIMRNTVFWQINRGEFNYCENARFGPDADPKKQGEVAPIIIVTPVRISKKYEQTDEHKKDEQRGNYASQVTNLHKMCICVYNFADFITNIQLHSVPFLDTNLLAILIPQMRKLEAIGIYQCQLINVGDTLRLLDIVKTDRILERQHSIRLDFRPNYHAGPVFYPGNKYCTGEFGITWDNWNANSILAVWCLIRRIIPQARSQGIDFESIHTAFRQWLDKGPCWKVEETLKAINDPQYDPISLAALVDCSNPDHDGKVSKFTGDIGNRPEGWEWMIMEYRCNDCCLVVPGVFYPFTEIWNLNHWNIAPTCLGCKLTDHLRFEKDHYKLHKRDIIRHWVRDTGVGWNQTNIKKCIHDFTTKNVARQAEKLDDLRLAYMTTGIGPLENTYDRERDERQVPLQPHELQHKLGGHSRSPLVTDKDKKKSIWNTSASMDNRYAHGRW